MKDWFKFRIAWLQAMSMFELEEAGRLFKAVITYGCTGEEPILSGAEKAVFTVIAQVLREDAELSEKRAVCGALGGRPKRVKESKKQSFPEIKQSFQLLSEAPEGPRTKGLDSASEASVNGEHGNRKIDREKDIYISYPSFDLSESQAQPGKEFVSPSVEEVAACCRERGYSVNAAEFVDYYAERNWMVGNEPMRDWKACLRAWERNGKRYERPRHAGTGGGKPAKTVAAQQYSQRDYSDEDEEAFQRMLENARKMGY